MKKILFVTGFLLFVSVLSAQMTQIQITGTKRYPSYSEISYKMRFTLPAIYGTGTNPIAGLSQIAASFPDGFSIEIIPVTGTIITYSETRSIDLGTTINQIQTGLQNKYSQLRTQLDNLTLSPYDNIVGLSWNGSAWGNIGNVTDYPLTGNLAVTAVGTAGAAVTLTLPAVTGNFHNITHIQITAYTTSARTGNATPITVTSTNLPGSPAWTFATAGAVGTTDIKTIESAIKSSTANTNTTIVCPATTNVIWRVQVIYNTIN